MSGREHTYRPGPRIALLVGVSLALHVVALPHVVASLELFAPAVYEAPVAVHVIDGDPLDALTADQIAELVAAEDTVEPEEETPPEPEPDDLPDGQVVETPPPDEEKKPLDADYLAEHDNAVPAETRADRYKVNPDVLSNAYSEESKLQFEDAIDVGATEKSTGATTGNLNLSPSKPGKGPPSSLIPSQWQITNKEGLAAPTLASSRTQSLSGAPQNDLLNEKKGDVTALNTREFVGAAYINRIRRQVNFYWQQNIDNLSPGVRLSKPRYATIVDIVLTSDGALEAVTVTDPSGAEPLDVCVVDAFKVAGPFPNPPEQLVKPDGRVYLSDLEFDVTLGHAQMQYQGIDPRAGVQFPGIMKSPR
ncbi:MAG: energy transducer TonB family protein [Myxococcota bacterium]